MQLVNRDRLAVEPLDPEAYQLAVGQDPSGIWFVIDRVTGVTVALVVVSCNYLRF